MLTAGHKPMRITDELEIEESLIEERFVRASGPGGQHVNKTSSAVQLRFNAAASTLPAPVMQRLVRLAGQRMSKDGVLVIHVEDHRSQTMNRAAARERLRALVEEAARPPKVRRRTRPKPSSIRRVKAAKSERSRVKALRRKPGPDE